MNTNLTNTIDNLNRPTDVVESLTSSVAEQETLTIPVIEERIVVDKQVVETGRVRIVKHVLEEEQTVNVSLTHEQYNVERVPVNQYVDIPPAVRQEGNVTIYPVLQEVLVTEKRLMLVEEVRVTRQQHETTDAQRVLLRREEIVVERTESNPERSAQTGPSL